VRTNGQFGLLQSSFSREFAAFVDFVGGHAIDKAVQKVEKKLRQLRPETRSLFGDRFYFHEQFIAFTYSATPFRLDTTDFRAVRAASLIAGINRIRMSLSAAGAARLRSMVLDNLQPDRDVRQIEHEVRSFTHLGQKGWKVIFADLEGLGSFDLLLKSVSEKVEVECKTITEDTGSQIKVELNVELSETFRRIVSKRAPVNETGLFALTLKRPSDQCKHLARQLKDALQSDTHRAFDSDDFSLQFSARPSWQELLNSERLNDLREQVLADVDLGSDARCVTKVQNQLMGLVIRPHKPTALNDRVIEIIKEAANQCSRQTPSVVWLHFVGMVENDFIELAQFSSDGTGRGLNAIVANALHPDASPTDRTHVQRVRFSADPKTLTHRPALRPDLLISRAVSANGVVYDVPNPYSRFAVTGDL
jgi:hypothetical protein